MPIKPKAAGWPQKGVQRALLDRLFCRSLQLVEKFTPKKKALYSRRKWPRKVYSEEEINFYMNFNEGQ